MSFGILIAAAIMAESATEAPDSAHYSIALTVVPAQGSLAADTIITLPPVKPGEEIELMLGGAYVVTSVRTEPGAIVATAPTDEPWAGLQRIPIRFAEAASAPKVRIASHGRLGPSGTPPLNSISPNLIELNLDSMWLPIRSDLGLRFSGEALIAGIPEEAVLAAQGSIGRSGPYRHVKREAKDFDFAFAAAPAFRRIEEGSFELYAADPESPHAQLYRRHGAAALRYLEAWLGPMPGDTARIVLVSRERKSGYARRSYIVFTEGGNAKEAGTAKFTAHELSHAWFSNANATTQDRWLDESIAEYVSLRFVEEVLGRDQMEMLVAPKRPVAAKAKPLLGGGLRGDPELYNKGPLLLFELEDRIGRKHLDQLIRVVAERRIGASPEFLAALAEISDAETAAWFEARLRS